MKPFFNRILFGGDYSPNQWPKEIWEEDMRIFRQAHINSATVNVFSWAKIQPAENEYNFSVQNQELHFFFKDDWKVTNSLTLNLGVRYEYYGVPHINGGRTLAMVGGGRVGNFGISEPDIDK